MWSSGLQRLQQNPHRWRLVCETDSLEDDQPVSRFYGIADSVPVGFRLLRISDDDPDQGRECRSLIIAVREYDLIDVQVRHQPGPPAQPVATDAGRAESGPAPSRQPVPGFVDCPVREAVVRVFNRKRATDEASDMYVLEVFGVSVLLRLRTTRNHPASGPQVYLHVDNETRGCSELAVEVANGGETYYRI